MVAMVGTTTVQRQGWEAYYGNTVYHLLKKSFKTAVGAGKGLATILWKIILVDFKPHGVVVTTVACQGLCYDILWKQFDDVLTCLPKVCCLCTIINHTAHAVIALLDTRHWKMCSLTIQLDFLAFGKLKKQVISISQHCKAEVHNLL
jgi:hypothetical protein